MLKHPGRYVLYPEYFDRNLSRAKGRKVAYRRSQKRFSVEALGRILTHLGYEHVFEKDKHHPSDWYLCRGRVWVEAPGESKPEILKKVGRVIEELNKGGEIEKKEG